MDVQKKSSQFKKVSVLVITLILPAVLFYFLVYAGVHKVKRLKFYGPKTYTQRSARGSTVTDTVYHSAFPKGLKTLNEQTFPDTFFNGKIYLLHFINSRLLKDVPKEITFVVSDILPTYKELYFVTVFENPDTVLQIPTPGERTRKLKDCSERWLYLKADSATTQTLRNDGYFKEDPDEKAKIDPYSVVLCDKDGHIRGYYNPVYAKELSEMKKEISLLYKEYELALKSNKYIDFN